MPRRDRVGALRRKRGLHGVLRLPRGRRHRRIDSKVGSTLFSSTSSIVMLTDAIPSCCLETFANRVQILTVRSTSIYSSHTVLFYSRITTSVKSFTSLDALCFVRLGEPAATTVPSSPHTVGMRLLASWD